MNVPATVEAVDQITGSYQPDPAHSRLGFAARYVMVTTVHGSFDSFGGEVHLDGDDPTKCSVVLTIDTASIRTNIADRDAHLRSADFFDVENHPTITFRSTRIRTAGKDRYAVDGDLSIRGVTRPVTLDVEFGGITTDPWGGERAGFSATAEVDREEFGLTWNQVLETGGLLVGKRVKIEIEAELVRQPDGTVES